MNKEKIIIYSPIKISEVNNDKPYIELTSRLCYLDYLNLNKVGLSSKAKDSFDTLIDMPIVAKINSKGDKFGSHEVKVDKNGKVIFNTSAYGTHVEVWVEDDEVDIPNVGVKIVPCLFARSKVWKRFENVVNLIINKMENPEKYNGGLFSSWELQGEEYHKDQGGKMYDKFTFLSNCFIDVPPAYGKNSKTLFVSSLNSDEKFTFSEQIQKAFEEDIKNILISQGGNSEMAKNKTQQSALNMTDLYRKLWDVLNPRGWDSNPFYSVWEVYPEDHQVICKDYSSDSSDELIVFNYIIDNEENITLGEKKIKKLSDLLSQKMNVNLQVNLDDTAKLISEKETKITELKTTLSEKDIKIADLEKEIAESGQAIIDLTKEKEGLKTQISELTPFKEKVKELEKVEQERLFSEKKDELKTFTLEDNLIAESELEENEIIKTIFSELTLDNYEASQKKIELIKGRKAIAEFKANKGNVDQNKDLEISQTQSEPKTDLNNTDDKIEISAIDFVMNNLK